MKANTPASTASGFSEQFVMRIFAALLTILAIPYATAADARAVYQFNLPEQPLSEALKAIGQQTTTNILFDPASVLDKTAPALRATLTTKQAIEHVLQDTDLTARESAADTVLVQSPKAPSVPRSTSEESVRGEASPPPSTGEARGEEMNAAKEGRGKGFWSRLRLAQADSAAKSDARSSSERPDEQTSESSPQRSQHRVEVEEVIVTGTHIRGMQELAAPSLSFTRQDIEKTGYPGLKELFEELPQNFDSVSFDGVFGERMLGAANSDNRADRASAINLRGLGAGSTLTLLNGTRRAGSVNGTTVDVSTIPLSVIERVEIVTGGRSAIYGSDAVGGVVNLVTRRDFEGVETQAQYGFANDGGEALQLNAITGIDRERGGFVAAYDYQRDWPLDLLDTGFYNSPIPVSGNLMRRNDLRPDARQHAVFLSGRLSLGERVGLYADGLYTNREHDSQFRQVFRGTINESFQIDNTQSDTYSISAGVRTDLGNAWSLDVSAGTSAAEKEFRGAQHFDLGFLVLDNNNVDDTTARVITGSAVASGPVFSIGGITPRAAFGVERREENLERFQILSGIVFSNFDRDRSVSSVFGELLFPLVDNGTRPALKQLTVSLAGRYDDYADFGGTFNPEVGLIWKPFEAVTLRSAYSTAFRSPALVEVGTSNLVVLDRFSDPNAGGALVPVLVWSGDNPDLGPEEATTWSFGIDYEPVPSVRMSLSYFDIEYDDRIGTAAGGADYPLVLQREARFVGLVDRSPTAAEAAAIIATDSDGVVVNTTGVPWNPATQDILTVFPGLITFDNRTNNLAVETVKGLDATFTAAFDTRVGELTFGLNGAYAFEHERSLTATSPSIKLLNESGRPVDLRIRGSAGWTGSSGALGAFMYVNYVDDYNNPLVTPAVRVSSWTTIDLSLRLNGSHLANAGWLNGVTATLSAENLLDRDPPELLGGFAGGGYRFDAANASALGRYISLRLVRRWR